MRDSLNEKQNLKKFNLLYRQNPKIKGEIKYITNLYSKCWTLFVIFFVGLDHNEHVGEGSGTQNNLSFCLAKSHKTKQRYLMLQIWTQNATQTNVLNQKRTKAQKGGYRKQWACQRNLRNTKKIKLLCCEKSQNKIRQNTQKNLSFCIAKEEQYSTTVK